MSEMLTDIAASERAAFFAEGECCSCHICPPCGYCTHPGNPANQEEDETAWMDSYTCQYCGADSELEPSEQLPPRDYCHQGDHERNL